MKAVIAVGGMAPDEAGAFRETGIDRPAPGARDLLVHVHAVSVNPVDTKVHARMAAGEEKILGWDACGVVEAVGSAVTRLVPGDRVFYAGDITRPGTNAEYHLIDERLAGRAPESLSAAEAAAMPLTTLTAWEALFVRLGFTPRADANAGSSVLVIGGAGGVGSMALQLARWAGITAVATASREDTTAWCLDHGASLVVDHRGDIPAQLAQNGHETVDAVFCTTHVESHWQAMARAVRPQGSVCLIDDPTTPLDITLFKQKSARICWEFMYTRSMFATEDMAEQGSILDQAARLVDAGTLRTTLTRTLEGLSAKNLADAHLRQLSGRMIGKQVVAL
ncbi:zinc-binding alcohol dehydrogenase family protein [Desulfovibrio sp. X2]|uniref:zinc-binding alcohol dehydrogenase family protein n=1 Tax=Desulfovibrio sp. X2 TaxID=941449 RepID=UPI000358ADD2|nr:zinc-binding alcohol dehydrogenase family protein [Desulfovibrio sp. X2]EPR43522.1 zinc-binding alcohol dehydrogenase family protein [Desulfovibrio sp. X2]